MNRFSQRRGTVVKTPTADFQHYALVLRYVERFCRMTIAIVKLSGSPSGAYTCNDTVPIQRTEM